MDTSGFLSALAAYAPRLVALLGVWSLLVITPGPDFAVVSRTAVARSRRAGILVGMGTASGIAVWVTLSLAGLGFAMAYLSGPLFALRLLGALYLIYLGARSLWSAAHPQRSAQDTATQGHEHPLSMPSWVSGFLTNIGNPKALAFFGSIFALFLPAHAPLWLDATILVGMVSVTAVWYTLVSMLFSLVPISRAYRRAQRWVDAVTGGIFVALGIRLAANG
jgi:threonine/homoserine/homoserine lactone efflux protein